MICQYQDRTIAFRCLCLAVSAIASTAPALADTPPPRRVAWQGPRTSKGVCHIMRPGENNLTPALPHRPEDADRYRAVCALAEAHRYEREHTHQVTRLAMALFDGLAPALGLNADARFLLQCGAMLHDIGWSDGRKAHHKTAQRLILAAEGLPFDDRERTIVALVARYHRKALPAPDHEGYADLGEADRRLVRALGGILRVADGLDRSHVNVVRERGIDLAGRKDVKIEAIAVTNTLSTM